jgi:hypothetical protein
MNVDFKEKFLKYTKTTILIVLIALAIGLSSLIMNVFAGTSPSACIGTNVQTRNCQSCLDLTASPTTISAGNSSTLTLKVESRDNSVPNPSWTMDCSIDNGVRSNTTFNNGSYNYSVSPINTTTYTATCTGIGQNPPTTVGSVTVTVVDTTPPTISFNPTSRSWANTDASVTVTASDTSGISATYYCWTTGVSCAPGTLFTNGSTLAQSSNSSWTLCIKARDNKNNEKTDCSGPYQIDKTKPIVNSFSVDGHTSNFSTYDTSLTIAWLVSDSGGSNLSNVEVWRRTDGGVWSNIHSQSISGSSNSGSWTNTVTCGHSYEYGLHAFDNAGNMGIESSTITATVQCNQPPTAANLSVTKPADYCGSPLYVLLTWQFSDPDPGDTQKAYQVQVDNNSNFSSPEIDSGKVDPSSSKTYTASGLSYKTTYYWRLKVWDDRDLQSGWISGPSFLAPTHIYPDPDFTWSPSLPSVDEITQFCAVQETGVCPINESSCYDAANNLISCSGKTFLWTFPVGTGFATGTSATSKNPRVKFDSAGQKVVSLQITDDVGTCSTKKEDVGVTLPLPEWEEAAP